MWKLKIRFPPHSCPSAAAISRPRLLIGLSENRRTASVPNIDEGGPKRPGGLHSAWPSTRLQQRPSLRTSQRKLRRM